MLADIVRMAAFFPWWLSIGLGILLFVFVPLGTVEPGSFRENVFAILIALVSKYGISLALVLGGVTNLLRRGKSAWMFGSIKRKGAIEMLRNLSWKDFEFLVSEYFKRQGYVAYLIDAQGADGGVDIRLQRDGNLFLVQCKHYQAWRVSVQVVRELYGVMAAEKAQGGFVIATGRFTGDALAFAQNKEITLIDGKQLGVLLQDDLGVLPTRDAGSQKESCPKCGSRLVRRNGSRGVFLGCSAFPKCRYTADVA